MSLLDSLRQIALFTGCMVWAAITAFGAFMFFRFAIPAMFKAISYASWNAYLGVKERREAKARPQPNEGGGL